LGAYPPVFYVAEGLAFLILGPSVLVARVTVLLFALFGLYFWFLLVAELQDEITAAITTLLVAFLPSVLLYEKAVMLEIPALALSLAASYYWIRYLRECTPRLALYFAVFAALALLTKVQTAYLALWCVLSVTMTGRWRAVLNRATARALLLSAVLVLPYYAFSLTLAGPLARANVLQGGHPIAHPLLFYLEHLPSQIGWSILVLAVAGVVVIRLWEKPRNAAMMLTWIVACYVTETAVANKEARYIIYWIPPLVYLAVAPLGSLLQRRTLISRVLGAAAIIALVSGYSAIAWSYRRPYVSGYSEMARHLVREPGGYVLTDSPLDGDLIFFTRAFDPAARFVIDRKALHVENQVKEYGYIELAHSTDDIRDIIRKNGFRYIIIDSDTRSGFESQRFLREVLQGPEFKCLYSVPIESNMSEYTGDSLVLYENTQAHPPQAGTYHVKMLTLNHDISVPRAALDSHWPTGNSVSYTHLTLPTICSV